MNGMFNMQQPMMPTGIEGAIGQVSGGMGDDYTNRLLSALGLGGVSDYNIPAPMQMQQPMYNPYMYGGMFSPMMQQPMMQSPMGSFGENNYLDPTMPYNGSRFGQQIGLGLTGMPGLLGLLGSYITRQEINALEQGRDGGSDGPMGGFSSSEMSHDMGEAANPGRSDGGWGL